MDPAAPRRRGWRQLIGIAAGVSTTCIWGGIALASSGGGVGTPGAPSLTDVACVERCADIRAATAGSLVELSGHSLSGVDVVKFVAGTGGRISVGPSSTPTDTTVRARVPRGAASGTVRVSAYGVDADTPEEERLEIVAANQIPDSGGFKLTSATASPRNTYYDGGRDPRVSYVFAGSGPTDVRVEIIDTETNETVAAFIVNDAEPNARNTAKWDGLASDGKPAPDGEYGFRIGSAAGGDAEATRESRFRYHTYRFPIDARHSYGDGFGAGRDHEGQDVFAPCGTPLRAVRGGRVQTNDVHSAAGNYVVIDGKGTKMDFVYAHMLRRSPLREGARVRTGDLVGNVGQSGNASGCHLHLELWSAPGWYEGGNAMASVGRLLKAWDSWS